MIDETMAFELIIFVAGCVIGIIGSFCVSKYFHKKSMNSQQFTDNNLSDIRTLIIALHRKDEGNTFQNIVLPLLRSIHNYVLSLSSLGQKIKRLKKAGSNHKVQMLIGEIEMFNESLSDSINIGENLTKG